MPSPAWELYDRHAADFDAATELASLPESFHDLLESFVDVLPGPAVLDAGCGPGRDAAYFHDRGLDPVGVDVADGMLERARARRPGRYLKMDVRDLGFVDGHFDGVWCPASVFFVPADGMAAALAEFRRVLRPGGGGGRPRRLQAGRGPGRGREVGRDDGRVPRFRGSGQGIARGSGVPRRVGRGERGLPGDDVRELPLPSGGERAVTSRAAG